MESNVVEVEENMDPPEKKDIPVEYPKLLFSQLCVYYYTDVRPAVVNEVIEGHCVYTESIATNLDGEVVYKKTPKFW